MLNFMPTQINLRTMLARLLGNVPPTTGKSPDQAKGGIKVTTPETQVVALKSSDQSELQKHITTKQGAPAAASTPLEWLRSLPGEMSLVIYIHQQTTQIVEMLAVSRRQVADLFRVLMNAGTNTHWQTMGPHRLRHLDFPAATRFAKNSHPTPSLEELLNRRRQASTKLPQIVPPLVLAKQQYDALFTTRHGKSIDDCPPLKQGFLAMQDLMRLTHHINAACLQLGALPPNIPPRPS